MRLLTFFLLGISLLAAQEPTPEPIVVVGGGVGGLSSALYLGRAGHHPLVIDGKMPGGLLTQTHAIQNWPGEIEISGDALTEKMRIQAERQGARFISGEATQIDLTKAPFRIVVQEGAQSREILASKVILAMGTTPNLLHVPGESTYWGKGVSTCAVCDGTLYKGEVVGVVGGGDAAVIEALYLANLAKKVYLFVRKDTLRATDSKRKEALFSHPNIEVLYQTQVQEILGTKEGVTGVVLKNQKDPLSLSALFLAIGSTPNTKLVRGQLALDPQGYIQTGEGMTTSIEGVYAVGDIQDPIFKQAVSAAGDGAKAALHASNALVQVHKAPDAGVSVHIPALFEVASLQEFEDALRKAKGKPVIVDFYASWCAPCKRLLPELEASAEALQGKVQFIKVNVDLVPALAKRYKVRAMPTVVYLDGFGAETDRKVGSQEVTALLQTLR